MVPDQHYFMGGVWVDHESHTSMDRLYAVGETACNGVHGKNRLASNSLLESLVFAKRAAKQIEDNYEKAQPGQVFDQLVMDEYRNQEELASCYHKYVRDAIIDAEQSMDQEPEMTGRRKAVVAFRKK